MRLGAAALTTLALLLVATPAGAAGGAGETTITGGFEHGCAIVGTHTVRCWGSNDFGQLGNGQQTTFGAQTTPIDVEGVGEKIAAVAGGLGHTCAIVSAGGGVRCWGYNAHGQLGTGDDTDHLEPSDVVGLGGPVRDLVAGHTHTCAVVGGAPYCWGHNESGQLGDGQPGCDQTNLFRCKSTKPVRVAGLDDVAQLGAGRDHTCALTQGGAVYCWGTNISGQLGTGGPAGLQTTPVLVPGLNGVVAISAGGGHTCALNADGAVACWGLNDSGQLGDGSKTDRHRPVVVIRSGVATIFAAEVHTCAITTKRAVACWGRNQWGELGDGTTRDRHKPVPVSGLGPGSKVTELAGGYQYTCAREGDVDVLCWGKNQFGQLADGTTTTRTRPVVVRVACLNKARRSSRGRGLRRTARRETTSSSGPAGGTRSTGSAAKMRSAAGAGPTRSLSTARTARSTAAEATTRSSGRTARTPSPVVTGTTRSAAVTGSTSSTAAAGTTN